MAAKLCNVCNTRRVYTGSKGTETAAHGSGMCNYCWEEGSHENQHSDHDHEGIAAEVENKGGDPNNYLSKHDAEEMTFMANCWICHPELNLAQKPAKQASTAPKEQGYRRPQLNHKGHSHPQTPAARRACKLAFWAQKDVEASAWDCHLDGFGKTLPTPASQAATWSVVPSGPKGGVINQLKKGNPAKASK